MEPNTEASSPKKAKFSDDGDSGSPREGGGGRGFRGGRGGFRGGRGSGREGGFRGGRGRGFGGEGGFRGGRGRGFRGSRGFRGGRGFGGADGDRGRGFRGSRGRNGRGEYRSRGFGRGSFTRGGGEDAGRINRRFFFPPNERSNEYVGYPGWSADDIHWILDCKHLHKENIYWNIVSQQLKRHSAEDCEAIWNQIKADMKPVAFKTSLDYVKEALANAVDFRKKTKYEEIPKGHKSLVQIYAEKENLTMEQIGDFQKRLRILNPSKKAEYQLERRKASLEHNLKCFDVYKEHPNIYEDMFTLQNLKNWEKESCSN